ncbi:MAG TPA: hypothetical protein VNA68_01995 [Candidatus Dormibacteraeota bacterium]|nr:hypothetical protein [Candidatus Dormibacteraeota bacterium]
MPPDSLPDNQNKGAGSGLASRLLKGRRWLIAVGVSGSIVGLLLAVFFAFLAPFKLMFMKENIDKVRLARLTHIMDQRSDRFLTTLIKAEVAGTENGQNRYFVAKGWATSTHPFTQWYTDMRTDKFFDDMEKRHGIRFVRETGGIGVKDRLVKLDVRGQEIDFSDLKRNGGLGTTNVFERAVEDRFESNKEGRRAFNSAVKDVTKRHQIVKRYYMRKWAYERLGITKWRFFENTREKAGDKVRARWTKTVSKPILSGRFGKCLFGTPSDCPRSGNSNDEKNSFAGESIDPDLEKVAEVASEEARSGTGPAEEPEVKNAGRIAGKFVNKAIPILNIVAGLETAKHIEVLLGQGGLVNLVATMRAAEYASAYFTFATATDQLKSGETVSGEEVDAFMQMTDGMEKSDGYKQVVGSHNAVISFTAYAQSNEQDEYDPVTDMMKVNSDDTKAAEISNTYKDTFGKVIGPIVGAYNTIPIIGDLINAINDVIGKAVQGGLWVFGKITGVDTDELFKSLVAKMMTFLGGAPACSGEESGGRMFNCIDGGAAVTQEALSQTMGGRALKDDEVAMLNQEIALEQAAGNRARGFWSKLASIEEPDSVFARLVMATPASPGQLAHATSTNLVTNLGAIPVSIARAFSAPTLAQQLDNNLYGVKRYGFNKQDLESEPFDSQSQAECDLEMEAFNTKMAKGEDPETSMCMLDTAVANSLSCAYSDDDCASVGAEQGGGGQASPGGGGTVSSSAKDSAKAILDLGKDGKIDIADYSEAKASDSADRSLASQQLEDISNGKPASGTTRCGFAMPSEIQPDPKLLQFLEELGQTYHYKLNSLFGQCHSSSTSNHYKGKAVDFGCPLDTAKADEVGRKYGVSHNNENCTNNGHWHYSVGGR